jgi:multidrug efflux pump subunit AcrA (membrane-fusion protein)
MRASFAASGEYRTVKVQLTPINVRLSFIGTVIPSTTVPVVAPFEGIIREKRAGIGDRIHVGDTLIVMDTSEIEMRFREAESALLKAQLNVYSLSKWEVGPEVTRARRTLATAETVLENAQRQERETKALFDRGIVARMEHDGAAQQLNSQRLQVETARQDMEAVLERGNASNRRLANIELANASSRFDTLKAQIGGSEVRTTATGILSRPPASGTSGEVVRIETGARVNNGQVLFIISDTQRLLVSAKVDEVDVNRIQINQAVEIDGDAFPGKPMHGRIISVSAEAAQSEGGSRGASFDIRAAILEADEEQRAAIRIGMSARITVEVYSNPQALVVPHEAISNIGGVSHVQIYDPITEKDARVPVVTGVSTETGVEIRSGLMPGTLIVLP